MTGVGDLLFLAALWVVPLALLWISWHRYSAVHAAAGTNRSFAGASLVLLFLSSGIWIAFYGFVLIGEYCKAVNSVLSLGPKPATLAVANIVVCFISFVLSLFMPKSVYGTVQFQRAITFATGYMLLVWMFALTAH